MVMLQLIIFLDAVLCITIYNPERFLSASLSPYFLVLLLLKQQFVVIHWYAFYKRQKKTWQILNRQLCKCYENMVKHGRCGHNTTVHNTGISVFKLLFHERYTYKILFFVTNRASSFSCTVVIPLWVGIATRYGLDGRGNRIPVGARFFAPVQTGPGAHIASYTMGTGLFLG